MDEQPPCVLIRDLRFCYPNSPEDVLRIPSLSIHGRSVIALTGPSGAGKSTLVELLAGTLREPYQGSVQVLGTELKTLTRDGDRQRHVRRVGLIPQDYGLLPGRTVEDILRQDLADAEVPKTEHAERIARALAQVELSAFAQRPSERLSGGQRQRVAIARMLARDVDLVIADEPTANLDPDRVAETVRLLRHLAARVPVIVVTHDTRVMEQCDRTIVLQAMAPVPPEVAADKSRMRAALQGWSRPARWRVVLAALTGVGLLGGGSVALAIHSAQGRQSAASRTATSTAPALQGVLPPTSSPSASAAAPPGIWCPQTEGVGQNLTAACEMFASPYAPADSEGPGSASDKLGGQPVAETCSQPGQCAWLSGAATAAGIVATPWAIVAMCTPSDPQSTILLTLYATLVYQGRTYYSWGTVPCADTYPSSFYEFRRGAAGSVQIWALNDARTRDWDVILVQR